MKTILCLICIIASVGGFAAHGQVGTITGSWRQGDTIINHACMLLADGRVAMNETRYVSAEDLAKRCSTGLRITSKGAFEEPESIVVLFGLKSNARLEGIQAVGWQEYWFADTSALTINRVTKILELKDNEQLAKVIAATSLWNLKNQDEIEGFKDGVADGYSVEVELFSEGHSKQLHYSNPDAYDQNENLQFRAALHKLLADLGLSSDKFVYGLSELTKVRLPSANKKQNEAEQAGADQPATKPADKVPAKDQPSTPTPKGLPR